MTQEEQIVGQPSLPPSSTVKFAWLILLTTGLVAGAGAGYFVDQEKYREYHKMPQDLVDELAASKTPNPPQDLSDRMRAAGTKNDYHNAALVVAISGAILGGLIGGLCGGIRRKTFGLLAGLVAGALLGAAAGYGGGWASKEIQVRFPINTFKFIFPSIHNTTDELLRSMMMHAAAWGAVGLGTGLAVGVSSRSPKQFIGNALMIAVVAGLAGAIFPFLAMCFFPSARTARPIPSETDATIFWVALTGGLMGLTAGRLVGQKPHSVGDHPSGSTSG